MKFNKKIAKEFLEIPSVSGREEIITKKIIDNINEYGLELSFDNLGSILAYKKTNNKNAKTLMIDAHMDEVGFMVTDITKNGLISFESIGGVWNSLLNITRLRVWKDDFSNSYSGVVSWPGINTHKKEGKVPEIDKMFLDIGASSKEEVKNWGISKGNVITFDVRTEFNGNRVISKAVDDRLGVLLNLEIIKYISNKNFDFNIGVCFSVQEETGLVGGRLSAFKLNPDLAMIIDVSPTIKFPIEAEPKGILGGGTMLRHKDARTIYSRKIIEYLRKLLKENKIKYQNYFSLGGTNAGSIHISREGIPIIPIGLVARNLHSGSSIFDVNDFIETMKLIKVILEDLSSSEIEELGSYDN